MKPDWDKLIKAFEGNPTQLVADVDCTTTTGQVLCQNHGVQGMCFVLSLCRFDPEQWSFSVLIAYCVFSPLSLLRIPNTQVG
jgi:hypothetical protein